MPFLTHKKTFETTIITLYPELFPGPLDYSLSGRALDEKIWSLRTIYLRDFAEDKHKTVDDSPYGGGPGMVMRPDVVAKALDAAPKNIPIVFLSPRGKVFTQNDAKRLAQNQGLTLLCGHFEGIDVRAINHRFIEEISIGDYILSGGELAVFPVLDAIIRLLPNVLGNVQSLREESFEDFLLEHDAYTRPRVFEGQEVPQILLSGDHGKIALYRQVEREKLTKLKRPDLYARYLEGKERKGKISKDE